MSDASKNEAPIRLGEESVAKIVAAFASRADVQVSDILDLLNQLGARSTSQQMQASGTTAAAQRAPVKPAMPQSDAVTHDKVYCLCCGRGFAMLKRHLGAEHGLTEAAYREMFSLPDDFPLVAPSYSDRKAAHAKQVGLGKYAREAKGPRPGSL